MFTTTSVPKLYFCFFTSKIYKPVLASPAMYATLQIMLYGVNARPWTGDLGPGQDLTISGTSYEPSHSRTKKKSLIIIRIHEAL